MIPRELVGDGPILPLSSSGNFVQSGNSGINYGVFFPNISQVGIFGEIKNLFLGRGKVNVKRSGEELFSTQALESSFPRRFVNVPPPFNQLRVDVESLRKHLSPNSYQSAVDIAFSDQYLRCFFNVYISNCTYSFQRGVQRSQWEACVHCEVSKS